MVPNATELLLKDVAAHDFRPLLQSPLVGAAVPVPPSGGGVGGGVDRTNAGDAGAYQHDDQDPWIPGCTFSPSC